MSIRPLLIKVSGFLPPAIASLLPALVARELWLLLLRGGRPRSWDGSGHYARAEIYARDIFPVTLKLRRRHEYNSVRLAEEQFANGWFDVLLVRSRGPRVDRIEGLDEFGALILDRYECADEGVAFERLRAFAARRPLILLSSQAPLFVRIKERLGEFTHAVIVERAAEHEGEWMGAEFPSEHYRESPVHREWLRIKDALARGKVAIPSAPAPLTATVSRNVIRLDPPPSGAACPSSSGRVTTRTGGGTTVARCTR